VTAPYRVLVVDDDPDIALVVSIVLTRAGMVVDTATDPLAGLTLATGTRHDVVISDIEMPGMSGLEFLDRLRALHPAVPVVVMTAHASVSYAIDALRRRADEFLVKPTPKDVLVATVTRLAEAGRRRAAAAGPTEVVLAIGAHPDDVEIGLGGTLAAHRSAGHEVVILTLSRGARGGTADDRQHESLAAAELIGARLFLEDQEDTRISEGDPTVSIIERVVASVHPTTVYTHSMHDRHQDHRAVHAAANVATRDIGTFACFQSPSATVDFKPNRFVTIDGFTEAKLALLACFSSQAGRRTYLEDDFVLATSRYWSRYGGGTYCEPLEVMRQASAVLGAAAAAPVTRAVAGGFSTRQTGTAPLLDPIPSPEALGA
jgi:LmbE family N-acetylglucosaminyl deacetylase/CheY-like chemotaxis protein